METDLTRSIFNEVNRFLKEGNWAKVQEYCDLVLRTQPNNTQAYIGKLMADYRVDSPDKLCDVDSPLERNENYRKAIYFADEDTAETLQEYNKYLTQKNERDRAKIKQQSIDYNRIQDKSKPQQKDYAGKTILRVLIICIALATFAYAYLHSSKYIDSKPNDNDTLIQIADSINKDNRVWTSAPNDSKKDSSPSNEIVIYGKSYYHQKDGKYYLVITEKNVYPETYKGTLTFEFYGTNNELLGAVEKIVEIKSGYTIDIELELPTDITPSEIDHFSALYIKLKGYD